MLEAAHLWLVCRDGAVQFSCSSVQLRSYCQRFATGPARFSSVLARSVNAVLTNSPVSQQDSVTVGVWNARSINSKLGFIKSLILFSPFHILCITETWLNNNFSDQDIIPPNYTIKRRWCGNYRG